MEKRSKEEIENEKRENFKRVFGKRFQKTVKAINMLGKCSNSGRYMYLPEEIAKAFAILREQIDSAESMFSRKNEQVRISPEDIFVD